MVDRFAALRRLTPPKEAHVLWVELSEEALHFVDGIFGMYDGLANVRREYREVGGRKFFKIFVAPGCLSEALEILERAKRFVPIGEIQVEAANH